MKIAVVNSFMNDAHREKITAAAAQRMECDCEGGK